MEGRERIFDEIPFEDFLKKYEDRIREVQAMINKPFETELVSLEEQISTIASRMEFIGWCLAKAEEYCTVARFRYLQPKKEDVPATAASIILEQNTRKASLTRDILKNVDRKMEKYLDKAQSVLASLRLEKEKFGYGRREV